MTEAIDIRAAVLALISAGVASVAADGAREAAQGAVCEAVRAQVANGATVRTVGKLISETVGDTVVPRGVVLPSGEKDTATLTVLRVSGAVLALPVADGGTAVLPSAVCKVARSVVKGSKGDGLGATVAGAIVRKASTQGEAMDALRAAVKSAAASKVADQETATAESELSATPADGDAPTGDPHADAMRHLTAVRDALAGGLLPSDTFRAILAEITGALAPGEVKLVA